MKYHFVYLFILLGFGLTAQPNYDQYDAFLQRHVAKNGNVNYKAIKANTAGLDSIIRAFQAAPPQKSWSKNEQLAYWLNAYNAFTIHLIVSKYPLQKIIDLDGGKTWDVKRIELGGKKYSLNEIENEIIRPQFKDARIHFALNCAARSCPPLHNRAFRGNTVQNILEQRTRQFIRSSANDLSEQKIKISKIFDWYKADFGDIAAFLNKYATVKIASGATVEYIEYNWQLNENGR
jgi:Protein of unknown function, DUF547